MIAGTQASITALKNSDATGPLTPEEGEAGIGTGYRGPYSATSRVWWHAGNRTPHTHTSGQPTPVNRIHAYTHQVGNRAPYPPNTCMASDTMPSCHD